MVVLVGARIEEGALRSAGARSGLGGRGPSWRKSDDDLSVLEVEDAKGETRSESDQVVHFGDAPGEERVEILDM